MISTFTALFDANVFFGARLTSLVLFLAQTKMFRARWNEAINEEWVANLHKKKNIPLEKLERRRVLMNAAVLDCRVTGYESLIEGLELPDPEDRHVLAAAIRAQADVIVTFNLTDFPSEKLDPLGITAVHPDAFITDLFGISSELFVGAVREDFLHYKSPALAFDEYLQSLLRAGLPQTAALIESLRILIEPA
jgi:predicted nucleic acid-binding protein